MQERCAANAFAGAHSAQPGLTMRDTSPQSVTQVPDAYAVHAVQERTMQERTPVLAVPGFTMQDPTVQGPTVQEPTLWERMLQRAALTHRYVCTTVAP